MHHLPATMDAVLLLGHGGPEQLLYRQDVPVPEAGPGEVLIAVRAAGVNNTDINTRIGWYAGGSWAGAGIEFPRIQGADVCGDIVAVGDGVPGARMGEPVIVQGCLRSLRRDGRDPWVEAKRHVGKLVLLVPPVG